ncbi:hypothetical protein LO772_25675 [Yinghuangia sp. ASG 101]|uniref:hypothetical protein n=1 Tax=Yinghuangia sp. ASG 101 TaxID=2896848 RepID=UPI001E5ED78D|nr:hypothetical protein [Yinghuangia sp. ASG 101]UGQ15582.1 hypothetical protein LO772_25675 [Yinghuangia sp. ASG 101]
MSLPKTLADEVAKNLVMTGRLVDEDAELAYRYSRVALRLASRVAAVREAAGIAAYMTGRYMEALSELRAARRMTGSAEHWAVMADCERGLGRPERALQMAGAPEVKELDKAAQIELRIVAAGARRDMGQLDAAVVTLQVPELNAQNGKEWTGRLRYAYADALFAAGREDDARDWFARAADADADGSTGAAERLAELDGLEFVDAYDPESDDDDGDEHDVAAAADRRPEPAGETADADADEARDTRTAADTAATEPPTADTPPTADAPDIDVFADDDLDDDDDLPSAGAVRDDD